MGLISFVKKWTLPCAMVTGVLVYFLFSEVEPLEPIGTAVAPYITEFLPVLIFLMFYVMFCTMRVVELRFSAWHFWLQLLVIILSALFVGVIALVKDPQTKVILEGVFVNIICPTAIAAPIITEKLGGNKATMTVYAVISNFIAAVTIPIFFPLVEKEADITFLIAFLTIFKRLLMVFFVPFVLAQLSRRFLPKLVERIKRCNNLAFYIWGLGLSIVMGITVHNIVTANVGGYTMMFLIVVPLFVTVLLFSLGKAIGNIYSQSITAGQGLGQKNTIIGIWLTVNYLNPTAAIALCSYAIWQNIVNSWQLWYKEKYGNLRW